MPKRKSSLGGNDPRADRDPVGHEPLPKVRVGLLPTADPSANAALRDTDLLAEPRLRTDPNDRKPKKSGTFSRFGTNVGDVDPRRVTHQPQARCQEFTTLSSPKPQLGTQVSDTDEVVAKQRVPEYEDIVRRVGKRLNTRRDEAGLSLREVERMTGISVATISRIENGLQREMLAAVFFKLCETLQLDPLLAWYGDARKPTHRQRSEPPPASVSRSSSRPPK